MTRWQEKEDEAYKKLINLKLQVEMSEGYIPISMRRYEVFKDGKSIFKGGILEFIKFVEDVDSTNNQMANGI
jgi:hypothetical protein